MTLLADLLATLVERRPRRAARDDDRRPMRAVTADLIGATGEIRGLTLAATILDRYAAMDDAARRGFFDHLAADMAVDPAAVRTALDLYEDGQTRDSYGTLMAAAEPPRQELIRRLNHVPGATGALVAMRADLLRLGRDDPALMALDLDFRHLFASWFNRGFLILRPISWESPAHILEKIIAYEAVHQIDNWRALRARLEPPDRRCFAFFHPAMPDEPLIFVEVALTRGLPGAIGALLAEDRAVLAAEEADTAVFYSISNCQRGLAGITFGNSLIKQVVADLASDLPDLRSFATLSPIPGLRDWLGESGRDPDPEDADTVARLAARYLLTAKRPDGRPRDPVARFHLGNGASVHRIHARADQSDRGRAQSAGAMVSYLYDLRRVAQNHERYAAEGRVAAAAAVTSLAAADLPQT
ncbi:decarboxylase [Rhodobacteraceae bacterium CCMM004]|nr:decarboxylase [Rhodobacteraceae bacterium CCMM004]